MPRPIAMPQIDLRVWLGCALWCALAGSAAAQQVPAQLAGPSSFAAVDQVEPRLAMSPSTLPAVANREAPEWTSSPVLDVPEDTTEDPNFVYPPLNDVAPEAVCTHGACSPCNSCSPCDVWHWQILPDGLIYRAYQAGVKESRFSSVWFNEKDQGLLWDIALGGQVSLLRYGTGYEDFPEGWEIGIEGAAFPRLDPEDQRDLVSTDFRFGIPLSYGEGPYQVKLAYYHLSSHLGDEFLLKNLGRVQRLNYTRDCMVLGNSYYYTPDVRFYGEVEYGFHVDGGAEPWHFQFGIDYLPCGPTGFRGAPFAAVNVHLRQEVDFGGHIVLQSGWVWRGNSGSCFRVGLHLLDGKSPQFEFYNQSERQLGCGLWYDF